MARAVLAFGAGAWFLASLGAVAVALAGVDALLVILPPLAIGPDALRGAIVALAVAFALAAGAHAGILVALRRGVRVARSAAVLLCGLAAAVSVGLAGAAFASAAAEPALGILLVGAGVWAVAAGSAYALAGIAFVAEIRAGGRS